MTYRVVGPESGHPVGELIALNEDGEEIPLSGIPGEWLLIHTFKGHK